MNDQKPPARAADAEAVERMQRELIDRGWPECEAGLTAADEYRRTAGTRDVSDELRALIERWSRDLDAEFHARARRSKEEYERTGIAYTTEKVFARLKAKIEQRRREILGDD